jgi:hypothetical protein
MRTVYVVMLVYSNEFEVIATFETEKEARDYIKKLAKSSLLVRIFRDITEEK